MFKRENSKIINKEINNSTEDLASKSRDYIREVVEIVQKKVRESKILSIIIFGSQRKARKENTPISDCDLLIIFEDSVTNWLIHQMEKYLISLEIRHGFRDINDNFLKKVLGVIQQTTGMFVSNFLTRKNYWEHAKFSRIFQVNKFFSKLFAPRKIVLSSVIDNSNVLYGKDLRDIVKEGIKIPPVEMIKSTTMNLMISIFSIFITPFKNLDPTKYQLEAVKWALRASNYYSYKDSKSLDVICDRFINLEKNEYLRRHARKFYKRFLDLRKDTKIDIGFLLRCPLRILKIHIKGIIASKLLTKHKEAQQ
ncbi:MAG: nucleotidyltransferase domain-containing protein [Promethearchaeia archaeon]